MLAYVRIHVESFRGRAGDEPGRGSLRGQVERDGSVLKGRFAQVDQSGDGLVALTKPIDRHTQAILRDAPYAEAALPIQPEHDVNTRFDGGGESLEYCIHLGRPDRRVHAAPDKTTPVKQGRPLARREHQEPAFDLPFVG